MATSEEASTISATVPVVEGAGETIGDGADVGMVTFRQETDWPVAHKSVGTDDWFAICLQLNWVSR